MHPTPNNALPGRWQPLAHAVAQACLPQPTSKILQAAGLHIDLSAQYGSPDITAAAQALLDEHNFNARRNALLNGDTANPTELRAAWHTALRAAAPNRDVAHERQRMMDFVHLADAERQWRNVIHIGIGGSDWGVRLAVAAFGYAGTWRTVRFAANIDGHAMAGAMAGLDPRDTLIVVASKSFTTTETLENAQRAIEWLAGAGVADPYRHIVAITACPDKALAWGAHPGHIFKFWEWVGGRFSIWSSVGLTIALAVGIDTLAGLHAGAAALDNHFATAPVPENAPVQMAIAAAINRNILGYGSHNIAPYDHRLGHLVPYLQQLEMESLGKSVDINGNPAGLATGAAVWGMPGTDAQHTFFQWLHQSSDGCPVDFIVCQHADHTWAQHHTRLVANCLAQREALLNGKTPHNAHQDGLAEGLPPQRAQQLAPHRSHAGGRPSNLIVLRELSPYSLGALLALYEHKTFTLGVLWNINPFDQWGVEHGKTLAAGIFRSLSQPGAPTGNHDASTLYWLKALQHTTTTTPQPAPVPTAPVSKTTEPVPETPTPEATEPAA
ncbi:glucose-6-phosphate isomerase [Pusillimonas minor]|uniref:Glucose-6-phosphate isomerase n=1 Tax=Pusillimonas minor TaxID=2697024 RepID=A0A842HRU4_9BURK|nr:glucose-6-phosphate isomerase [Pusillimonas minor]MBC2771027.1 glucose-6-phosphate isomerase [Pusillimonas minor]